MWCCLHDPKFRCFNTVMACNGQTHDDDDNIYRASIASCGNNVEYDDLKSAFK